MPDTGAPWNIPYVAGTDLVSDWPTDSQTLAEAIADGLDAAGGILQVVQDVKTDTFTTTSSTFTPLTGLSVTITPGATANKVLILATVNVGPENAQIAYLRLKRDSTDIFLGDTAGNRTTATVGLFGNSNNDIYPAGIVYLDSPATTSATTYSFDIRTISATDVFVNRAATDTDTGNIRRTASSIVAIEVRG